jgi:hypothetical protein
LKFPPKPQSIDYLIPDEIKNEFYKKMIQQNRVEKFLSLNKVISNQDYCYEEDNYKFESNTDTDDDNSDVNDISDELGDSNAKKKKYNVTKKLFDTLNNILNKTMTNKEFNTYIDKEFDNIFTLNMKIYFNTCFIKSKFNLLREMKPPSKRKERDYIKIVLNNLLKMLITRYNM